MKQTSRYAFPISCNYFFASLAYLALLVTTGRAAELVREELPKQIHSPEMKALISKGERVDTLLGPDRAARASVWLAIPEARWAEWISDFAPASLMGSVMGGGAVAESPFGKGPFPGLEMSPEQMLKSPFAAKVKGTDFILYAKDEDMPEDYPWRPNHTEPIPHLDGTIRDYSYYVASGKQRLRDQWLCPAGELWRMRMSNIFGTIVPDLAAAALWKDDKRAVRQLCAIFDRLAEVYPGLPLYRPQVAQGFARLYDGKTYLTKDVYDGIARPLESWQPSPWGIEAHNYNISNYTKLAGDQVSGGWTDHIVADLGSLVEAWDVAKNNPASREWSQEKYGDPGALERKVQKGVVEEAVQLAESMPNTRGNTLLSWTVGMAKLGVATQSRDRLRRAFREAADYLQNGYYSDGLNEQGAFNYSDMMRPYMTTLPFLQTMGLNKEVLDFPFMQVIRDTPDDAVITLHGIESQHSDQWTMFFAAANYNKTRFGNLKWRGESQIFPDYGLAALRAGAEHSRLETILDFQKATAHAHPKPNLQVFYEGVNLMPDLGYGAVTANPKDPKLLEMDYPFELLPVPTPKDPWGAWTYNFNYKPETHVTVLVDGDNSKLGPATFLRFVGGQDDSHPARWVQAVEVEAKGQFNWAAATKLQVVPPSSEKMKTVRRQVVVITLANGRPLLFDLWRLSGGHRHEVLAHFPAQHPELQGADHKPLPADQTVEEYLKASFSAGATVGKAWGFMEDGKVASLDANGSEFEASWLVSPQKYWPRKPHDDAWSKRWQEVNQDVAVRMWSFSTGKNADKAELVSALGPWPSVPTTNRRDLSGRTIALRNAMNYSSESRQATDANLISSFNRVLEPRTMDQPELVTSMKQAFSDDSFGATATIDWASEADSGRTSVIVSPDGLERTMGDFMSDARVAAVDFSHGQFFLFDGSKLETASAPAENLIAPARPRSEPSWLDSLIGLFRGEKSGASLVPAPQASKLRLKTDPSWKLEVSGLRGDVTGEPQTAQIIVSSTRPLPTDKRLAGTTLTVAHQGIDWQTSGYIIEKIESLGGEKYSIHLQGAPPFREGTFRVRNIHEGRRRLNASTWNFKGASVDHYQNRVVIFPDRGFQTRIAGSLPNVTGWHSDELELIEPLPDNIQVGDSYFVTALQPGDEVVIPSLFSALIRKGEGEAAAQLEIFSTGAFSLEVESPAHPDSKMGSLKVEVSSQDLNDGKFSIPLP